MRQFFVPLFRDFGNLLLSISIYTSLTDHKLTSALGPFLQIKKSKKTKHLQFKRLCTGLGQRCCMRFHLHVYAVFLLLFYVTGYEPICRHAPQVDRGIAQPEFNDVTLGLTRSSSELYSRKSKARLCTLFLHLRKITK